MPEKIFDKYLKNQLDQYKAPFEPKDWDKMEQMLNAQPTAPGIAGKAWLIAAASVSLLIVGAAAGYLYHEAVNPTYIPETTIASSPEKTHTQAFASKIGATDEETEQLILNASPETSASQELIADGEISGAEAGIPLSYDQIDVTHELLNITEAETVADENITPPAEPTFGELATSSIKGNKLIPADALLHFSHLGLYDEYPFLIQLSIDFPKNFAHSKVQDDLAHKTRVDITEHLGPYIGIGIVASPEIILSKNNSIGIKGGITGEIGLSDQLSLMTGLIYAKRHYDEDAEPPVHGTTGGIVSAEHQYLEVPLHVKYALSKTKLRPFIAGGLTSYFPVKEKYDVYAALASPGSNITQVAVDQNGINEDPPEGFDHSYKLQNYLAVANIAAGLEMSLSESIKIHLSPQLNVGLMNMGVMKEKLTSVGLTAGLTYAINR